jgi:hypothetical protein
LVTGGDDPLWIRVGGRRGARHQHLTESSFIGPFCTARARSFGTTPRARSFGPNLYGTSTELRHDATFGRTCVYSYGTSAELRHDATSTELRALFVRHEHGASARRSDRRRQADAVRCLCTPPGGYVHRPVWTQWIYFDNHLWVLRMFDSCVYLWPFWGSVGP